MAMLTLPTSMQAPARRRERPLLSLNEARTRGPQLTFGPEALAKPAFFGRRELKAVPLEKIRPFIDWTFLFSAWELKGRYPKILSNPTYGKEARKLFDDALKRSLAEQDPVQALVLDRPDEPLGMGVGVRRLERGPDRLELRRL